jgi:hypothetical protein
MNGASLYIVVGGLAASACIAPDVSEVASEVGGGGCPPSVCGFNSPEIDHLGFHELHTGGVPNAEGFVIVDMERNTNRYTPRVTGGRLFGDAPANASYPSISGSDLVDATLRVDRIGQAAYSIRITAVGTMTYCAGAPDLVETYQLEYSPLGTLYPSPEWRNLCKGDPVPGDPELGGWHTLGQPLRHSILFEGDRIDMDAKTMSRHPDPGWFNIGCAGHTLAKLHLTRNTIASQPADWIGRWAERQATLKLLVADYCGTGEPFTVAGQTLVWRGGDIRSFYRAPLSLEARWNENGATCVDQPRMLTPTTPLGAQTFPDIWSAIRSECRPRRCTSEDPYDFGGALRVSAN